MRWNPIGAGLVLVIAGPLAACAPKMIPADIPIRDRTVEAPPPGTPPEVAWFLGRWAGEASDGAAYRVNNAIVVHRVMSPKQIVLTYGCGRPTTPTPYCPDSRMMTAQYENDEMRAHPGGSFTVVLRRRGDTIHYQFVDSGKVATQGTMWRVVEPEK